MLEDRDEEIDKRNNLGIITWGITWYLNYRIHQCNYVFYRRLQVLGYSIVLEFQGIMRQWKRGYSIC
jgi:hypothetical protein